MTGKHYEKIHKYDFLTKDLIEEEYIKNNLTDKQIAEKYDVSSKTVIWKKRKEFGIENKYKGKSNKNATVNRKFSISKEEAEELLNDGKTFKEIANIMGCSIIVSKRRFKELGLTKEQKHSSHYEYYDVDLSGNQKQMLIGSVLGDGTITKHGAYSCSHSYKQEEYFNYKRKTLYNLHSDRVQRYVHSCFKEDTESLHFTTGCNKYLYELRDIFYPEGKKIFPYEYMRDNLEGEGLSYWHLDDGNYYKNIIKLCTYGYSYEEQKLIIKLLEEKFNIDGRIDKRNSRRDYYISLRKNSTKDFINLIEPYIIPSMRYKIGKQLS
jgi:DNA-binding CsgD family transcriptional regulator